MTSASGSRPEAADGRLRRSERSRQAIVQALLDLVGAGNLRPTAEQVAERAGVGIRTVFRHFTEMENLYAAMDARLQAEALPLLTEDDPGGTLPERIRALVARRGRFFERIAPYKRSGDLQRWRSPFLQRRHAALGQALRRDLLRRLPELAGADRALLEALDAATSFEAWNRLRTDQRLGRPRAAAAMERAVGALLDAIRP